MDFKGAILTICFIALITGLFKMLVPQNNFKAQISFLIACFFAVNVISCVGNADFDLSVDFSGESIPIVDFTEVVSDEAKRRVNKATQKEVLLWLSLYDIDTENISVIVHISGMYSISINEIELVFSDDTDTKTLEKAVGIVQEKVGEDIKVTPTFSSKG